ncbi:MAG: hypothetical protein E7661_10550 [Ruminococcaceae bacterium]|nr:hypothetical protein [Oscillospiraceae bacterium]
MKPCLFDTHCDTAYELYHRECDLLKNNCHIDLEKASVYPKYAQYYAVWSNRRLDDETCWEQFLKIAENFDKEIADTDGKAVRVTNAEGLKAAWNNGQHAAILAVEDARLTAGKIERVDILAGMGVKYMTLLWGGETCIGGSHNTNSPLTDFGRDVARRCFEVGIVPDVSHASEEAVDDLIPIAYEYAKPFIATHSNSHAVYGHTRNLRDRHFEHIKKLGGIVGLSLCTSHLTDTSLRPADATDLLRHLEHYLSLGGEDIVGFGADWDGTDLPQGFEHVGHLANFAELMGQHNYSDELIEKIFWKNFYDFALRNL